MKHSTPEGRTLAAALADGMTRLSVTGHQPCGCGRHDCKSPFHGVAITIDGHATALATKPEAVENIIRALQQAKAFAWPGKEGA